MARDGRELFYRKATELLSIALDTSDDQLRFQKPRVLFTRAFYQVPGPGIINYANCRGWKRFLMLKETDVAQPMIRILQGYRQLRQ